MIGKNEFFREAALRIFGSLEIEAAMVKCVQYLREVMPVDKAFLQIFEPDTNSMRLVISASLTEASVINQVVPLSAAALEEMADFAKELYDTGGRHVWLFPDSPYDQSLTREIALSQGFEITSLMVMPLGLVEPEELVGRGSIVLFTEGDERFEQQHVDYVSLLREPVAIAFSNILKHQEAIRLRDRLADDNRFLNRRLLRASGDEIIGADFGLRNVMNQVEQVASTDIPVLLSGETGSGKDVVANAIHLSSQRRNGPFIPVNCGAIPESLIDSELFGHEEGAFTGALSEKRGRFERADGGTIFLDEIGEMPLEVQVRLLRVIQHREVERLGGVERIPVDIRIIAATNRDLRKMVEEGTFREDLFFRLNVFPITVPPLRKRLEDIPALVEFFIERKTKGSKAGELPELAPGALEILKSYRWPGNIRELENVVERAMILHQNEPLRFDELRLQHAGQVPQAAPTEESEELIGLDAFMANHISKVLRVTNGKIHGPGGAAEILQINANTLRNRMKKLEIPFGRKHVNG